MNLQLLRLTDKEFEKFSILIFDKTGIHLKSEKKELLNARLGKRLRARQVNSYQQYYDIVMNDSSGSELVHLINSVSTNFTSFFREKAHFDFLTSDVLPKFVNSGGRNPRNLTVWSSACSSGEEPYTLAMVIDQFMRSSPGVSCSIMATDISTKVLGAAEKGVYPLERVEKMPKNFLHTYFQRGVGQCSGYVKVKPNIRDLVTFKRFNLMDQFPWQGEIDVIFCRNVMIYFNKETQDELVRKFYDCLSPGGFLFIGHSESLGNIKSKFKPAATTVYQK
ncbi:MAG: protein-glutamate O-methyltransferase CheR [Desulfobulbaceae bacterium]|uniref:protein-glutamate O-methyltransferase n=1 Tax=Candidatus Desulfobia pelagia TaxID=2841692 RepID=A0A8J6NFK7_9BACT|nr:protein-glutamate O-methyltransferase CheR [Candidatus Desulfobia pelagia]